MDIKKIAYIAKDFTAAARKAEDKDSALEDKLMMAGLSKIGEYFQVAAVKVALEEKYGSQFPENEAYYKAVIQMAELDASVFTSAISDEEVKALLPEGAQSESTSRAFEALGAKTLARLTK